MRKLAALVLAALATGTLGCGGSPHAQGRSAILITLDTTRWDALGCAGAPRGLTPNLDAIAAEGVRYAWARSAVPLTLPAHASMLTGLYPPRHRVRGNGPMVLPPSAQTVAELASARGIETAAFVGALVLDRAYGIAQGFETYGQPAPWTDRFEGQISERTAAQVVAEALGWWRARDRGRPFFLWVHLFDPHVPYAPPQCFLEQAGGDAYLGEVAAADAAIGELLGVLRADGALDDALLIVAGDHGEAHGEHGEPTHGSLCYDATLRVPLLVRAPDGEHAGEVSDAIVSVVDVAPTLLDGLGLPVPPDLDGRSLAGAPIPDGRGVYFECYAGWLYHGWSPLAGWADARAKYLHSSQPEVFRPRDDPREQHDLIGDASVDVEPYRRALAELAARPTLAADSTALVHAQALQAIAQLGYAVTSTTTTVMPPPLAASERPAPQRSIGAGLDYERALALVQQGEVSQAVEILRAETAANGDDTLAWELLGKALFGSARFAEAADALGHRLRLPPETIGPHVELAQCLRTLGRTAEARVHELRAMELCIEVHTLRGELDQARRWREALEQAQQGESPSPRPRR